MGETNRVPKEVAGVDLAPSWDWVRHPIADVAVMRIPMHKAIEYLSGKCFPVARVSTNEPPRDIPLTAMGFPKQFGVFPTFAPLTREAKPASGRITIPSFGRFEGFLLDKASIAGYSGSPVFDLMAPVSIGAALSFRDGNAVIVGLVQGYVEDMTAVVGAEKILETLFRAGL